MKLQLTFLKTARTLLAFVLCASLFSFSDDFGGDSFTIYLNNKLIGKQYVHAQQPALQIQIDPSRQGDQLSAYYSHCGKIGSKRTLTIKNEKGLLLKEWNYADAADEHTPMTLGVKDITPLFEKGKSTVGLFYSSEELTDGQQLASLVLLPGGTARK